MVESGGRNLLGQRQLIALSRAVVHSSKHLILDKATAAMVESIVCATRASANFLQTTIQMHLCKRRHAPNLARTRDLSLSHFACDYDKIVCAFQAR